MLKYILIQSVVFISIKLNAGCTLYNDSLSKNIELSQSMGQISEFIFECGTQLIDFIPESVKNHAEAQSLALRYCQVNKDCLDSLRDEVSAYTQRPISALDGFTAEALWVEMEKFSAFF